MFFVARGSVEDLVGFFIEFRLGGAAFFLHSFEKELRATILLLAFGAILGIFARVLFESEGVALVVASDLTYGFWGVFGDGLGGEAGCDFESTKKYSCL